jgi:hypothetical protein
MWTRASPGRLSTSGAMMMIQPEMTRESHAAG